MQHQALAQIDSQIKLRPRRRLTIERAKIDKRRGSFSSFHSTAIHAVAEPAAPAVEARRTDRFALAEGFDTHAAAAKFRQQRLPFVLAAP